MHSYREIDRQLLVLARASCACRLGNSSGGAVDLSTSCALVYAC